MALIGLIAQFVIAATIINECFYSIGLLTVILCFTFLMVVVRFTICMFKPYIVDSYQIL